MLLRLLATFCVLIYNSKAQQQLQSSYPGSNVVTVWTGQGPVQGQRIDLGNDRSQPYYGQANCFLGIPYAQPPVGPLRFQPPQTSSPWRGTYNATYYRTQCLQSTQNGLPQSEDCLYLNVFSNTVGNTTQLSAVMVLIDGSDGLSTGGSDPSQLKGTIRNLVMRQVVVVTVQYRLGPLGFFTTNSQQYPANVGMLDQVMALQWVQQNIRSFGGDPNRVTLAGHDDGACAVGAHTLSPMSQGLFQQAILQSGSTSSCIAPTSMSVPLTPSGYNSANANYNPTGQQNQMPSPSQQLAQELCGVSSYQWQSGNLNNLGPCLGNFNFSFYFRQQGDVRAAWMIVQDNSFLPGSVQDLARQRPRIPIIIGTVQDENADYAFKLIANGTAQNENMQQMFNNWFAGFAQQKHVSGQVANQIQNVIAQGYNVPQGGSGYPQTSTITPQQQTLQYNQGVPYQPYQPQSAQQEQYYTQSPQYQPNNQGQQQQQMPYQGQQQQQYQPPPQYGFGQNQQQTTASQQTLYYQNSVGQSQYPMQQQGQQQQQPYNQQQYGNTPSSAYNSPQQQGQYQQGLYSPQQNQQQYPQNQQYQQDQQYTPGPNYGQSNGNYYYQGSSNPYQQNSQQQYYGVPSQYEQQQQQSLAPYTGPQLPQSGNRSNVIQALRTITQISSDAGRVSEAATEIDLLFASGNGNVLLYTFTYVSQLGRNQQPNVAPWQPVSRGQDMNFILMSERVWTTTQPTQQDLQVADMMGQRWTDFAKSGQVQNWQPAQPNGQYQYCNLNQQPQMQTGYGAQARNVFNNQVNGIIQQSQQQGGYAPQYDQQQQTQPCIQCSSTQNQNPNQPLNFQVSSNPNSNQNWSLTFSLQNVSNPQTNNFG